LIIPFDGNQIDEHRTPENRLSHATKLSFRRTGTANQRFDGSNRMEFEKTDGKTQRKILGVMDIF